MRSQLKSNAGLWTRNRGIHQPGRELPRCACCNWATCCTRAPGDTQTLKLGQVQKAGWELCKSASNHDQALEVSQK
ncbi:hypothetical protein WJX82_009520 [Trebouxia sp. C0006]